MANTFAPFGFAESNRLGAAPTYQYSKRWILYSNTTPIFFGDPVVQLASGYVGQATPGTVQIAGIFGGCTYMSISQKKIVESQWWPGTADVANSGTGFDISCKIIDDPQAVFRVATGPVAATLPLTQASVGLNAQFAYAPGGGSGGNGQPALNGLSTACLDMVTNVPAVTATFPFRIVELIRDPPGANGADPTTPYNWCYVAFNNQDFRVNTAI